MQQIATNGGWETTSMFKYKKVNSKYLNIMIFGDP